MNNIKFMKHFQFLLFTLLIIALPACKHEKSIDYEPVPVKIKRFDIALYNLDIYHISDSVEMLEKKFPNFFPQYSTNVISIGYPGQPGFGDRLTSFQTNKTIYEVSKRVEEVYSDVSDIEKQLSQAFGIYKHYFPGSIIPDVYSHISGFNQSIITSGNFISISLDKYLGRNEPFYNMLYPPIPKYLQYNMYRGKIAPDVVYSLGALKYPFDKEKNNLLAHIIYQGKLKYFEKQLMPEINDTLLWGFTPEQLAFCQNSEESMWVYLIEQKLLFETDEITINKFVNEAPFTKDFTKDSPGQAVVWIGFQIIADYMDRNKNITLSQLMENNNYQGILNESRYNP